ncbi:MAG: amidohydrolase [Oscillospiraceae bacterium]|nr:amidohydrolase [Oscillospiraceae bacterium]
MKTLFHADILTKDFSVIKGGYLGVDGDKIAYAGKDKPEGYASVRELSGHLLIPGIYNMHTHSSMVLLRGLGSDLTLHRWLEEVIFPIEERLVPDDISVGTRLAMMELLASGVTCFTDMYDMPRISAVEIERAGMKANLNRPILAFDKSEPYEKNFRMDEALSLYGDCNGMADGRIKIDFAIHAEYTSYGDVVRRHGEECKKRGAIMHLHLSETRKEHEECKIRNAGKTPAEYFNGLGVFDNPTVAAHCVMAEPGDIEIMREKGVTAVHNPSSNMKLASGFMPIKQMLSAGMNVAIGTDGAASNNNLNMFEEIHLASIIHKGYEGDPTIISPKELLYMATQAGAKAQGRHDCGALEAGMKADIAAIDLNKPHLMPVNDIPSLLVYSAQASDVSMTMADGKILFENGNYLTIDAEKVKFDLEKTITRLLG